MTGERLTETPTRGPAKPAIASRITLRQLRAFVAAGRHKSFTLAGRSLGLSQPAVTTAIRQLEETIAVTLFDRTTRNVKLTSDGEQFLATAERLLADFTYAVEDLHALAERRRERIGIASVFSFASSILPVVVRGFVCNFPAVTVHIEEDYTAGVCRQVLRNRVDFGFASRAFDDAELAFQLVLREQVGVVASLRHPVMKRRGRLSWSDLDGYEFLGLDSSTGTWAALHAAKGIPDAILRPRIELASISTLKAMLRPSEGITALPPLSFVPNQAGETLRYRPVGNPTVMRELYLITRKDRSLSRVATELKARILARVARLKGKYDCIEICV